MSYAPISTPRDKGKKDGEIISLLMADNIKICKGGFVCLDAAGYAWTTPIASTPFMGVAIETVDNTTAGHTQGGKSIRVALTGVYEFKMASGGLQALVGTLAYWSDGSSGDNASVVVAKASLGATVGKFVEYVSATAMKVRIDGYAGIALNAAS